MCLRFIIVLFTTICVVISTISLAHAVYIDMGNGTIYDDERSLLWQKSDDSVKRHYDEATTYCNGLSLGGRTDWALPSIETLSSLVDNNFTPTINPLFTSSASEYFSYTMILKVKTDYTGIGIGVRFVKMLDFSNGTITEAPIYENDGIVANAYSRCVVNGYVPIPESLNSVMYLLLK